MYFVFSGLYNTKCASLISYLKWRNGLIIQFDRPVVPCMTVLLYRLDIPNINFPLVVYVRSME